MTCIAAWREEDGTITMGGDSLGTLDGHTEERDDPKVFQVGEFLIGCVGSFRINQVLRFRLKPPKQPKNMDDYEYLCTKFIDHVRKILGTAGYKRTTDKVESGGRFLVGYRGTLYTIEHDFQVAIPTANFLAIGSGRDLALGAMYVWSKVCNSYHIPFCTPTSIVESAIEAAEKYTGSVGGKSVILQMKKKE